MWGCCGGFTPTGRGAPRSSGSGAGRSVRVGPMRLRKRHAWSAVLIALFALPVLFPGGFPAVETRVDAFLGWTARSTAGNPHAWSATDGSSATDEGARVRALEQV